MQITKPTFYKEFSCIAGACPDTCCAGWQIMIDEKSLQKYRRFKGPFRNRLHNDIDWKEHSFCQYDKRCAFLNEDNLCDIYSEAVKICYATPAENIHVTLKNLKGCVNTPCPSPARKPREFFCPTKKKSHSSPEKSQHRKKLTMTSIIFFLPL